MLSDTVAEQVTRWRKHRGWNREELATRCKDIGMPQLTAASITNIESGRRQNGVRRRQITVDELLVLAAALRVPAFLLITPIGVDHDIEMIPGVFSDPWDAYTICAGASPQVFGDYTSVDTNFRAKLDVYKRHDEASRLWMQRRTGTPESEGYLETIIRARGEIRSRGWRLPRLPPAGFNTLERGAELGKLVVATEFERGITS
jgi:transcriptional regulator with XRE-family HTH domain